MMSFGERKIRMACILFNKLQLHGLTSSAAAFLEQQISNCESPAHQEVNTLLPMHENKKGTVNI